MTVAKVLSALVENKPGALFRVIHVVRLMRLNIEGMTLGVTNGGEDCRITITLDGDEAAVEHVARQLVKVIDVLEAHTYSPEQITARELALVRINTDKMSLTDIQKMKSSRIVDSSPHSVVVEIVGSASEIDDFVAGLKTSVLDIARTGVAALPKEISA
ncbi:MAG: acetolactate synthase small subunit [Thaumarchaeota archaeon]|nr:acetolactate synthase small subunit [Nitrososphaerota archaeon]MDA4137078.1 acetolactate synthase small subunit [Nitrososphaerota archaeon]